MAAHVKDKECTNYQHTPLCSDTSVTFNTRKLKLPKVGLNPVATLVGVSWKMDAPQLAPPAVALGHTCLVMLQKENVNGPPIDEECDDVVESGHASM